MIRYIYQQSDWPKFKWDLTRLSILLADVHQKQGRLLGQMEALGFDLRSEANLNTLTLDIVKSSAIEGEDLATDQVRSSIARRLGMDVAGMIPSDRHIEGVVQMMLDATQQYTKPLTADRLFDWHAALFPTGRSGMNKISVGCWRDDKEGPMQVLSGPFGKERIHFQAPPAEQIKNEMNIFLKWLNTENSIDLIIKAGIAHFWFITIHPFEDGNGRIARAITDMLLANSDKSADRFYSMSAQIQKQRNAYYEILEKSQKNTIDITHWLEWFLTCLDQALSSTEQTLANVLYKSRFWKAHTKTEFNKRQFIMVNKLLEGFVGKLTSSKWAKITKCSQDTALRDIQELIHNHILEKETAGGRSTSYILSKIE